METYESIFVTHPELTEEAMEKALEKINALIKKHDGSVSHYHLWGKRKLAYEVNKLNYGVYHLMYMTASDELLKELQTHFRYVDDVIKFQYVRVEDAEAENAVFEDIMKVEAEKRSQAKRPRPSRGTRDRDRAQETKEVKAEAAAPAEEKAPEEASNDNAEATEEA